MPGTIEDAMCFRPSRPWKASSGSAAITCRSGFLDFRNRPVPMMVPPVPMPATKWVTRPSVCRQISGPVVS